MHCRSTSCFYSPDNCMTNGHARYHLVAYLTKWHRHICSQMPCQLHILKWGSISGYMKLGERVYVYIFRGLWFVCLLLFLGDYMKLGERVYIYFAGCELCVFLFSGDLKLVECQSPPRRICGVSVCIYGMELDITKSLEVAKSWVWWRNGYS